MELIYTWQKTQPAPFVSLDASTVWTAERGEERPLTLRGSSGLHRTFGEHAKARLGLGVERDFAQKTNEFGLEAVPEFRRKFNKKNSLSSTMKIFLGATEARKVSVQHYNTLLINLLGDLHVTIDANFFFHRDTQVEDLAFKSELQIGLGYTWDRKWF